MKGGVLMSYVSNRNLTNVVGRIDYISNEERQENIVEFYNSQDLDFWKNLAKENREQFKITSHAKRNRKPVEAREFIVALPQNIDTNGLAKFICDDFYKKYGVYCACSIHKKALRDENGNIIKDENGKTIYNLHFHLIYAERELLPKPLIVEERIAPRTYYYDAQGKKCKKAEAVKTVPKGTVLQKGYTRYFDNKKDFFSMPFVKEYKNHIENELNLPKFDIERHFPTRHIGKNNPKSELFSEYNELISELNDYFDLVEVEYNLDGMTPKQKFCELIGSSKLYMPQIDEIKGFMDEFMKLYPLTEKVSQNLNMELSETTPPNNLIKKYEEVENSKDLLLEYSNDGSIINTLIESYNMTQVDYIPKINTSHKEMERRNIVQAVLDVLNQILHCLSNLFEGITGKDIEQYSKNEKDIKNKDEWEIER